MKRSTIALTCLISFLVLGVPSARALEPVPSFPSCNNPIGTLKVEHATGTHGIAGNSGTFEGQDKVYSISSSKLIQCFCPVQGDGIQTIWWKVGNVSQAEIDSMVRQGWVFVPDGSVWGLESAIYLARNSNYSCNGGVGGGDVQGDSTVKVLGWATTGTSGIVSALSVIGSISILAGLYLRRNEV